MIHGAKLPSQYQLPTGNERFRLDRRCVCVCRLSVVLIGNGRLDQKHKGTKARKRRGREQETEGERRAKAQRNDDNRRRDTRRDIRRETQNEGSGFVADDVFGQTASGVNDVDIGCIPCDSEPDSHPDIISCSNPITFSSIVACCWVIIRPQLL